MDTGPLFFIRTNEKIAFSMPFPETLSCNDHQELILVND